MDARRFSFRLLGSSLVHVLLAGLISTQVIGEVRYSVTNLGTLGGVGAIAHAINDSGEVAGLAVINYIDAMKPFIWLPKPKYGLPAD